MNEAWVLCFLFGENPLTARRNVARDRDLGRVSSTTVGNDDLAARDIVLGSTSNVQPNLLDADEILETASISIVGGGLMLNYIPRRWACCSGWWWKAGSDHRQ